MKKKLALLSAVVATLLVTLVGCGNKDWFDAVYTYDRAIIQLPDGTIIEGKIDNWTDYDDGDQIQLKIDGKTYLVHSSNVVLIAE